MQANSYSQERGLTHNQARHHISSSVSTVMSSEPDRPTSSSRDTIARSMSRYKGKRQATPTCAPPMPKMNLPSHLQHSRKSSQPIASPSEQSSRRANPTTQSGADAREDHTASETAKSRKPSNPRAFNVRVGDTFLKTKNDFGDAQSDDSELGVQAAPNKQTASRSHGKDEPHVPQSLGMRTKVQQRDVLPGSKENGSPTWQDGRHNADIKKIERTGPPNVISGSSGDHPQVRHLRVESKRKLEKDSKSEFLNNVMHTPLPKKSFSERMADRINKYQPSGRSNSKTDLKRMISTPIAMSEGSEMVTPTFDAPISAVNAGERRVIVQCKDALISIPVTPTTTPVDIISASTAHDAIKVNLKTAVLLESFKKVGLERPLRRYEHIRDVLNSWDNDAQNTLTIVPSPTGGNDDDLEARYVSKEQPEETSVELYYSQKPGRWDKRWITLRSDGQVTVRKLGKDPVNICHLSDFDIYVPTPRQLGKKIKPPKKICFAVKSQQKSSMFLSTVNFVHFFSTSDKATATTWYKAVQQWRSWYLVNILGEGQMNGSVTSSDKVRNNREPITANGILNGLYSPSAAAHDVPQLDGRRPGTSTARENGHLVGNSKKPKSSPPISFPKKLSHDLKLEVSTNRPQGPPTSRTIEPEPFSTSGLLGRTYSQRQKAQREASENAATTTFHSGPTHTPKPSQTHEEISNGVGVKRTPSQRQKPKPLIDLTPQYQEPPQHLRKGRGIMPQQIPAGGLVDIATSPEIAIPIPPNRTWRRPGTSGGDGSRDRDRDRD